MHVTLAAVLLVLVRTVLGADSNPDENQGINDTNLFEGDIILTPGQKWTAEHELDVDSSRRKRGSSRRRLWPGGIIVYAIQSTLARNSRASAAIKAGMDEWTSKTCIRFKARTNERSYVYFRSGAGCSSYLGRIGKAQPITLARRCWTRGVVAHEIGHALGFYHEQSRPDRDNYITIVMANIRRNRRSNFHKYPRSRIDSLGTPYDYGSVMHYGSKAFSRNGRPTIRVKKTGATIGQRKGLSATDARQGNLLYNGLCPVVPTSPPSGCVNYTNLTDFDREKDYRDPQGVGKNDSSLTKAWYRFTGAAGKQMATKVVPKNHCSTRATGWLNGEHPTVAQGIVRHKVCFHWKNQRGRRSYDDPCRWSVDIRVLNCSSFFVYELLPTLSCCSLRYCGDDLIAPTGQPQG